ncbi:MAG: ABC transporter permease [Candidatus Cloacimonetes bacterium]|nr:ABC transporter permease [Candidatus Cloacimonadota bacterium]
MKIFSRKIAWRYLRGRQRRGLGFINVLNIIGIGLGVFAILTVTSVMNGFDRDIRDKILAFRSDIKVTGINGNSQASSSLLTRLRGCSYVKHATPVVENELLIQSSDGIYGTLCYGIEYVSYSGSTELENKLVIGNPTAETFAEKGLILGMDLAVMLNVTVGEYVQLSAALGTEATPFGLLPKSRRYVVSGIFVSGIPEYDQNISYVSLAEGQYFSQGKDVIDFIEVRSQNASRSAYYRALLSAELGSTVKVEDWSEYEANLFNAIRMEKVLMIIVLMLIVLLAGFNIAGNLNRLVTEKRRDIGILRAWGVEVRYIRSIIMQTGLYVGISGTSLGFLGALTFLSAQMKWQLIKIPVTGFPITSLPVELRLGDFILIPLLSLLIVLLASLAPAGKAVNMPVIRIIRDN